jgi:hypothetical protein
MRTFVTSWMHNHCLDGFLYLAESFFPYPLCVDVASPKELKSDQLIRLLNGISEEYFLLLEEDFYLISRVRVELLTAVYDFCVSNSFDRFTLQSKENYQNPECWLPSSHRVLEHVVYQATSGVGALLGMDASIWKRSFLLKHLLPGRTERQIEVDGSNNMRATMDCKIGALDKTVLYYVDVIRGGKQILTVPL